MVLFFIVALVAAYTNRSLIFEARTGVNQYRSSQALEAAEAGVEWALAMLNSGRITNTCVSPAGAADPSFRDRYLHIDAASGAITQLVRADGGGQLMPGCVFDGTDWSCSCQQDGPPALTAPSGTGVFPAFRVQFLTNIPTRPGIIRIESNGCTRLDDACLNFPSAAVPGEGRATVSAVVALRSGIATAPTAALTVRGDVNISGTPLKLYNSAPSSTGVAALVGGSVGGLDALGQPGSPSTGTVIDADAKLSDLAFNARRMFENTFGMPPEVYEKQPGAIVCPPATCNLATTIDDNPGRVIWVNGDLSLDSAGDIGSAAQPVVLVATGDVQFNATVNVFGVVYARAASCDVPLAPPCAPWNIGSSGTSVLHGAAISQNGLTGSVTDTTIVYDPDVLARTRWMTGSFVRVPGSWKDF